MEDKNNDSNRGSSTQSPIRGVPVMDIQAPRATFSPKQAEPSDGLEKIESPVQQDIPEQTVVAEPTQEVTDQVPAQQSADEGAVSGTDQPEEVWSTGVSEVSTESSGAGSLDPVDSEPEQGQVVEREFEPTPDVIAEPPVESPDVSDGQQADEPVLAEGVQSATDETPAATQALSDDAGHLQPVHKKSPVLLVVVAVVVALLLAGAAVFAYLQTRDDKTTQTNNATTTEQAQVADEPTGPVSTDELDKTTDLVDETMTAVDDTELSDDSLSDTSLGL